MESPKATSPLPRTLLTKDRAVLMYRTTADREKKKGRRGKSWSDGWITNVDKTVHSLKKKESSARYTLSSAHLKFSPLGNCSDEMKVSSTHQKNNTLGVDIEIMPKSDSDFFESLVYKDPVIVIAAVKSMAIW